MNTRLTPQQEVARYCAPAPVVAGAEGSQAIGAFEFESGERLPQLTIGFVTHGRLNAAADNAVLLLPGTTNTRHSADGYIGPGRAFDPAHHFIIAFEAIGAGTSSKPSDGLSERFPRYNIRDLVRAQHRVVCEHFGLSRLAVAGSSMGAFQALEWAIGYPAMVHATVLIAPAARAGTVFRSVVGLIQEVLRLDPRWNQAAPDMRELVTLGTAIRMYFPWTVSDAYLERMPPPLIELEIQSAIARSAQWHPWDYVRRYQASASHDAAQPFGGDLQQALAQVRSRTLVLPMSSERLLGSGSGAELARLIPAARMVSVPTDRGHLGWRALDGGAETEVIDQKIAQFLKETQP